MKRTCRASRFGPIPDTRRATGSVETVRESFNTTSSMSGPCPEDLFGCVEGCKLHCRLAQGEGRWPLSFISYPHQDKAVADAACASLRLRASAVGLRRVIPRQSPIRPPQSLKPSINAASCQHMDPISPAYEIDHVFICTSIGAPEAAALIAFGLREGSPNRHPGQGTANRRFFFENAFLELLWVDKREEVQHTNVRQLGLWQRWSQRTQGACPFGICYRPAATAGAPAPFESWIYRPPYAPIEIAVALDSTDHRQPLRFYLPYVRRGFPTEPTTHDAGLRRLLSATTDETVMALVFDTGDRPRRHDFRPSLPLMVSW
jgi:hypothetical protein